MPLNVTVATDGMLERETTPAMEHRVTFTPHDDAAALRAALAEADALVARRVNVGAALLDAAPRLRLVQQVGLGTDRIDLAAARERGVDVANTPGAVTPSVVEHTLMLVLAALRDLPAQLDCMREGGWSGAEVWEAGELRGAALGVIGYGSIGRGLVRLGLAFGARPLVHTRTVPAEAEPGLRFVDLETVLRDSDVVVVAAALTPETRGMIGAGQLAMMKPSAILVNIARGAIVDEEAMIAALAGGRLRGAALDAFTREPLPADSPLRRMSNIVLTPHSAGSTRQSRQRVWEQMKENLDRLGAGRELWNVVN